MLHDVTPNLWKKVVEGKEILVWEASHLPLVTMLWGKRKASARVPIAIGTAGKACYFWLDPKVTKRSSQQRGFFAAHGPLPCDQWKPGLQYFCPTSFAQFPRFSKNLLCPATARPTIVFPALARSFSADGVLKYFTIINKKAANNTTENKSGQRPAAKRGPCVKALSGEGFLRLDVWLLCI